MPDIDLNKQKTSEEIEDSEETWAKKLMQECEQERHSSNIDHENIYVETEEQLSQENADTKVQYYNESLTTAIERQIRHKNAQVEPKPSNTEKVVRGFWSIFKKKK